MVAPSFASVLAGAVAGVSPTLAVSPAISPFLRLPCSVFASALSRLPGWSSSPQALTIIGLLMVAAVVALIAWALQLMQAASDRKEFSLMLAGCMVCSAAVGLAAVMVLTLAGPDRLEARSLTLPPAEMEAGISLDAVVLPWDDGLETW